MVLLPGDTGRCPGGHICGGHAGDVPGGARVLPSTPQCPARLLPACGVSTNMSSVPRAGRFLSFDPPVSMPTHPGFSSCRPGTKPRAPPTCSGPALASSLNRAAVRALLSPARTRGLRPTALVKDGIQDSTARCPSELPEAAPESRGGAGLTPRPHVSPRGHRPRPSADNLLSSRPTALCHGQAGLGPRPDHRAAQLAAWGLHSRLGQQQAGPKRVRPPALTAVGPARGQATRARQGGLRALQV